MRKISYGVNSVHKTASIYIDYSSFWIFGIEWLFNLGCSLVPRIPFLPIPIRLWDPMSIEFNDNKKWTNLREWHGNLSSWFCATIHNWVSDYCWKRIDSRNIKVNYDKLKRAIYDKEKKFWDFHSEIIGGIDNEED